MTFTVKVRGAAGVTVAEYLCDPCELRFEAVVERDVNGDPPAQHECPGCGGLADHVISAPSVQKWSKPLRAVSMGKNNEKPPPWVADTRPLAEGMSLEEWNKNETKGRLDRTRQRMRKKGLFRRKRTIVGKGTGKSSLPT
jgi:hypothetical protein